MNRRTALALLLLAAGPTAFASGELRPRKALRVVTTLPILAEVTEAVGGSRVEVESLADPRQNPHFVEPRPTLMQRARKADVFIQVGLELEPWARRVVTGSGNTAIQFGQRGHIISSRGITTLQIPTNLTREEGNIHPFGNPYVWIDPLNLRQMADNIRADLTRIDPASEQTYSDGFAAFAERIDRALFGDELVDAIGSDKLIRLERQGRLNEFLEQRELSEQLGGWLQRARPLAGANIVSHHQTWIYFANRFGFKVVMEIEEKPGIPPSARHRERVLEAMRSLEVKTILIEVYQDRRTADWLAKRTDAKVKVVPVDVGPEVDAKDYFQLVDLLIAKLLAAEAPQQD